MKASTDPTIRLREPWGRREYAEIDIGIAPVIETLWRLRISTRYCCQGGAHEGHLAYVEFWNWDDAERFLTAAGATFGWILEPDKNFVRFRPSDISGIATELVRKSWRFNSGILGAAIR